MIRKKDMENSNGKTGVAIKETGIMVNKKEKEFSGQPSASSVRVSGVKVRGYNGWTENQTVRKMKAVVIKA